MYMRITAIYDHYTIMPSLRMHMLRVAGVADMICEHGTMPVDRDLIVTSCLLHDMGNIIKFNLDLFPSFLQPEGREYWQRVKNDFVIRYGNDEHEATKLIINELGINGDIMGIIDAIGFVHAEESDRSSDINQKIATYADMRVEPMGVTSLRQRLDEGNRRYKQNRPTLYNEDLSHRMSVALTDIESDVFAHSDIHPDDITEDSIKPYVIRLRGYDIPTVTTIE